MITGRGHWRALELSEAGAPVTTLDSRRSDFVLRGAAYHVQITRGLRTSFALQHDGATLAEAGQAWPTNRLTVRASGGEWRMRPAGLLARRYGVFAGEDRVGAITPVSRSEVAIDLPPDMPLHVQAFMMWLVLWNWDDPSSAG